MKALLPLLMVLLLSVSMISAQETPEATDWTTEERCITAPSQPPEGWTYDGVIFTASNEIHAARADVATPYYIGLDRDTLDEVGSLSPDGRWFAVLAGPTYPVANGDSDFEVQEIRVYSTTPAQTLFRIPFYTSDWGIRPYYTVLSVHWLDDENVVALGSLSQSGYQHNYVIDLFKNIITQLKIPDDASFVSASPDNSRWIYYQPNSTAGGYVNVQLAPSGEPDQAVAVPIQAMFNAPVAQFPQWIADSSRFAAVLSDGTGIGIFDRDGNLLDTIPSDYYAHLSFARDGKRLAYMTRGETIRIADFGTRTITDTCMETENGLEYGLALSPDGSELAFPLPKAGYVYILDIPMWQVYRINLAADDVVGWYPLE